VEDVPAVWDSEKYRRVRGGRVRAPRTRTILDFQMGENLIILK